MAQAFAAQAAYCSGRQDTDHPSFHGCVDWHSAAHAAWALIAYETLTGDDRYAGQVEAALAPDLIAQELIYVRERPDFEMPYGRAWFLRLAADRKRLRRDGALDALGAIVADSLRDFYTLRAPNPSADRYSNPSWALINLLYFARAQGDADLEAFVVTKVREHFLDSRCSLDREQAGFIAVCTTWAWLVAEALPTDEFRAWYAEWNPGLETLEPVRVYPSAHDYGRNFSRAWGLYHLAELLDSPDLRDSYVAHVQAGFEPESSWRGSYMANGHWVAQFGMLAITPLFSEAANKSGSQTGRGRP